MLQVGSSFSRDTTWKLRSGFENYCSTSIWLFVVKMAPRLCQVSSTTSTNITHRMALLHQQLGVHPVVCSVTLGPVFPLGLTSKLLVQTKQLPSVGSHVLSSHAYGFKLLGLWVRLDIKIAELRITVQRPAEEQVSTFVEACNLVLGKVTPVLKGSTGVCIQINCLHSECLQKLLLQQGLSWPLASFFCEVHRSTSSPA